MKARRLHGPLATTAALAIAAAIVVGAAFAPDASAQGRGATPPKPKTTRPATPRKPAKADPGASSTDAGAPLAARAEATSLSAGGGGGGGGGAGNTSGALDAGAVESRTLDGGSRVFRFGEVEIEGRLRNPQLVYFLRRVRAEFASGDLGHRTFMRELSETRKDPSF